MTLPLRLAAGYWQPVSKGHRSALRLADRHYSRQTPGASQFMPPGRTLVLLGHDGLALWGVCENLDPAGTPRLRCTIFRNESPRLSSDLVRAATAITVQRWPGWALTTEIDPAKVRRKRDPGRCFIRAGWRVVGMTNGRAKGRADLVVLEAPRPLTLAQPTNPEEPTP